MAGRRTNQALLALTGAAIVSGVVMFAIGNEWNRVATLTHGAVGLAVLALSPWKATISRRGLRRRGTRAAAPSLALVTAVVTALVTGFAHRAGSRDLGPVSTMQVHVTAATVVALFTLWHVRTRPVPLPARSTDLTRRAALRGGLLAGGTAITTVALPHASDRFTRSLERGSFEPTEMPVTQWFLDEVPAIGEAAWRLTVADRSWTLAELRQSWATEVLATLDCTGGWYAEQRWGGVPVDQLLAESDAGGGRSIEVRSSTGYVRRFPLGDAPHLLLATAVGGHPLSRGHGYPARLVAPGRRGFWWVKWVDQITVGDRPWWLQPPFPLQ